MAVTDQQPSYAALVAEVRQGIPGAFDQLVERDFPTVYAIAFLRLRDREAAEEIAQEVFLRAWLNIDKLRDMHAFGGWVASLARNLAIDWQRKEIRASRLITLVPVETTVNEISDTRSRSARDTLAGNQEKRLIDEAMGQLAREDRELIRMHYSDDLSHREIARQLGIHHTTVGRRIDRALAELRRVVDLSSARGEMHPLYPRKAATMHASLLVAAAAALTPGAKAALVAAASAGGATATASSTAAATGLKATLTGAKAATVSKIAAGGLLVAGLGGVTWHSAYREVSVPPISSTPVTVPPLADPATTLSYSPGSEMTFRLKPRESARVLVEPGNIPIASIDFNRIDEKFTRVDINWPDGPTTHYMLPFDIRNEGDFNAPQDRMPCEFDFLLWYSNNPIGGGWETVSILEMPATGETYEYSLHALKSVEFLPTSQKWFDEYYHGRAGLADAQRNWLDDAERMGVLPTGELHRMRFRNAKHVWNP